MTDTPKETPKSEPVPGSRENGPRKPGRDNPTVPPRALGAAGTANPPAGPAAQPGKAAAPEASAKDPGLAVPPPPSESAKPVSAANSPASSPLGSPRLAQETGSGAAKPATPAAASPRPPQGAPPPAGGGARPPGGTTPPGGGGGGRPASGHGRRDHLALPVAAISGVLALAALGVSLSNRDSDQPSTDPARVAALEQRVEALQSGPVAQLGQTVGAVQQQLQALQSGPLAQAGQRLDALAATQQQNQQAQQQRLDALQQRADQAAQQLAAQQKQLEEQASEREAFQNRMTGRIEQAERNFSQSIDSARSQLEQRIEQRIAAAEQALNPRFSAVETAMQQRIASAEEAARQRMQERDKALDERFATLEKRESRLNDAERRLNRLIATTATESALEAGRPLGHALSTLPEDVPPALRRYADTAPPTEASLRLAFEDAAREARASSQPSGEGQSVWESAANRLGNLVTVRRGDNVVWGDPAGSQLEAARRALDAGDLRGAVKQVEGLPDSAKAPMQDWLDRAHGLLAARDALQQLRAGGQG
ncbi:hypothetical protein QMO56_17775 [Roseomonas sp. E05]|uniref:COG4223 family protein n=1 Tax=Roseomonas sp. E05 TaxID=3046310 RepID=UPI0024B8C52F|nr:hypothetical protein [Roseomonas sp. E05]MDJ0389960.1 hypothetical protein [Roseomonas sp. E05]